MKHCWFKSSHCPRLLSWVAGPITAWRRGNGGMSHMWAKYKLVWIFLFRDGVASSPPPHPRISLKMCCMCEYSMWVRFPMGAILLVWSSPWDEPWIWHCFFFFSFCFSLFTVSFELTTGSLILLLLLLLLYFIQMFYYFRYNSPLSGMPKSLCMCVCFKLCADNHGHVELYTINPVLTSNGHFCELQTVSNIS